MLKLKNIEKEKFDEFVKNHKTKSHFLQSLSWGEFARVKKHLTPYYLGLVNENDEIKLEFKYNLVQKLVDRNIIQATAGEETTLYNLNLQELCTMKDADIELKDNEITEITNGSEKIILDKDGNKK